MEEIREKGEQTDACAVNTSRFLVPPTSSSAAGNCRRRSTYPSPAECHPPWSTFQRPPPAHITAHPGAGLGRTRRIRDACGGDLLAHWPQPTQVPPPQARSPACLHVNPSLAGERPDPITAGPSRAEGAVPQDVIELRPSLGQRLLPNGNSGAQDQSQRRAFVLRPMNEGVRESPNVSGRNPSQWAVESQAA